MKNILIALSIAPCLALVASQSLHKDSKRLLTLSERTSINGGGIFADCNTPSCPNAGTCVPTGGGTYSTFYYNNGHTACGFAWSSCSNTGSADCLAKDHSNSSCTASYGSQFTSSTQNYYISDMTASFSKPEGELALI